MSHEEGTTTYVALAMSLGITFLFAFLGFVSGSYFLYFLAALFMALSFLAGFLDEEGHFQISLGKLLLLTVGVGALMAIFIRPTT